jgi:hypothetical protein
METSDLAGGLSVDRLGPASEIPAVQGQTRAQDKQNKRHRHPSASVEDSVEALADQDAPQHQIDKLA